MANLRRVQALSFQPSLLQTVFDRIGRKIGIVLLARKPLFLRGGHYPSIDYECRSTVMIVGRQAQDVCCHFLPLVVLIAKMIVLALRSKA